MGKKKNRASPPPSTAASAPSEGRGPPAPPTGSPPLDRPPTEPASGAISARVAAIMGLALVVAAGAAGYLLYAYIQVTYSAEAFDSACNFSETLNCDKLNTSTWGKVGGVPITVFAFGMYAALAVLVARARAAGAAGRDALLLVTVGSGASVVYGALLLAVMVFIEHVYCLFCLTMDAMALLVFVLALVSGRRAAAVRLPRDLLRSALPGLVAGVVAVGIAFLWFSAQRTAGETEMKAVASAESAETKNALAALGDGGKALQATGVARKIAGNLYEVPVGPNDASAGPTGAAVTVVEYADFACGYCKKLSFSLTQMKAQYEGKVRWVFKDFPMNPACNEHIKNTRHQGACESAVAGECARRQDRFWPMHDLMFKNQHKLGDEDLLHYAEELGLDLPAFRSCLRDPGARAEVQRDVAEGGLLELGGTPRTFVNGQLFKGVSAAAIEAAIQAALGGEGLPQVKPEARPVPATPAEITAAPAMTRVDRGTGGAFFIDTFEASKDAAGRALSLPSVLPANASWFEANAACAAAGKRLCTTSEWVTACQGADAIDDDASGSFADDYVEGWQFPYADWHEPGWCEDAQDGAEGRPALTASKALCRTPRSIFDLGGNVAEWAGENEGLAVLLGGDFGSGDKAGCFRPNTTWGPGHKNVRMGFRCCADSLIANRSTNAVEALAKEGLIGSKVPAFTGELMAGGTLDSKSFAGQVTYLTFFASWCTPCRQEFPELKAMHSEFAARGFSVVSIGVDTDRSKSEAFARSQGASFPIVLDPQGKIQGLFDVKSMPTTYILDRKGVIQHKQVGFSAEKTPAIVLPIIDKLLGGG